MVFDRIFPKYERLHLFGDDKQLPPVISTSCSEESPVAQGVRSLYDVAKGRGHTLHELSVQHRCGLFFYGLKSIETDNGGSTGPMFVQMM